MEVNLFVRSTDSSEILILSKIRQIQLSFQWPMRGLTLPHLEIQKTALDCPCFQT